MIRRQILFGVAVAGALFGLALAFAPGVVGSFSLPETVLPILAAGAVLAGLVRAWKWVREDLTQATPPQTERGQPIGVPGDDVDARLARVAAFGTTTGDRGVIRIRKDLRAIAVAVLVEYRGLSESEAERRLAAGEWTDDPLAAEFFVTLGGAGTSLTESVAGAFFVEGPFQKRARRAIDAIASIAEARGED